MCKYTNDQIARVIDLASDYIEKYDIAIRTIKLALTDTHGDWDAADPVISMLDSEMRRYEEYKEAALNYNHIRISIGRNDSFSRRRRPSEEQVKEAEARFEKALFWAEH